MSPLESWVLPQEPLTALGELQARAASALTGLTRKYGLACAELTERQLVDVIRQALACGDLQCLVRGNGSPAHSQAVVYMPFAGAQRLRARLRVLEQKLREFGIDPSDVKDYPA